MNVNIADIENGLTKQLTSELATLSTRRQELQAEADQAGAALKAARDAVVNGEGTTAKLTAAQSASTALTEAVAELDRRIESKWRAIADAQAQAKKEAQQWQLAEISANGAATVQQINEKIAEVYSYLDKEIGHIADLLETNARQVEQFAPLDKALGADTLQTDDTRTMREIMQSGANMRGFDETPRAAQFSGSVRAMLDNLLYERMQQNQQRRAA